MLVERLQLMKRLTLRLMRIVHQFTGENIDGRNKILRVVGGYLTIKMYSYQVNCRVKILVPSLSRE